MQQDTMRKVEKETDLLHKFEEWTLESADTQHFREQAPHPPQEDLYPLIEMYNTYYDALEDQDTANLPSVWAQRHISETLKDIRNAAKEAPEEDTRSAVDEDAEEWKSQDLEDTEKDKPSGMDNTSQTGITLTPSQAAIWRKRMDQGWRQDDGPGMETSKGK